MKVKAIAFEDIPAKRMMWMVGIGTVPDRDPKNIYIGIAKNDGIPDFVSTRDITENEEVIIAIPDEDIWEVEASEEIWAGTQLASTNDGTVKNYTTSDTFQVGYSLNHALPGEIVKVARRKKGASPSWVAEVNNSLGS